MKKVWQDISKALAASATFVTFYSFYLQKKDNVKLQQFEAYLTETKDQQAHCVNQSKKIQTLFDKISEYQFQNKTFEVRFHNLQNNMNQILKLQNDINGIETQVRKSTETGNVESLLELQQEKLIELKNLYVQNNLDLNQYGNYLTKNISDGKFIEQSNNALNKEASKASEEIQTQAQDLITNVPQDTNSFGPSMDIFNNYKEFLSTLSLDQLACLANARGLITILFIITSIYLTLFGSYLIDSFNLETRFPKLAKIIKLRQDVTKFYITIYIIFLYLFIFALISVNLFLLLT